MGETTAERLGRLVRARRERLCLFQEQLGAKGGPRQATLSQIERGLDRSFSTSTYRRLENALQWEPGTIDVILSHPLSEQEERRLVLGPAGVAVGGVPEDDAELLVRVSDAALTAEIERRLALPRADRVRRREGLSGRGWCPPTCGGRPAGT